jgi:glycosyltransferase involved in cell wall biosynthesis
VITAAPSTPSPSARRFRLLVVLSHPIQYLVPLMRKLAAHPRVDLMVCFMKDTGLRPGYVEGYGETIQWDIPLLDGYPHRFLDNVSPRPGARGPLARINPGVVAEIARGRYDAVLLHGYVAVTEWLALAAAKVAGVKVLFSGDVLVDSARPGGETTRSELFRRAWCRGVDAALPLSTQAKQFYERYGVPADRMFWVPLAVDNDAWMARSDELRPRRGEWKAQLGLDPELPAILYVAHMRPNKRPVDVVRAFERMKVRASLVMVGDGPLHAELAGYVKDRGVARVHLAGMQNQSALPRFYATGDVFVLPSSRGEVTPLVLHESMCSSLPLVVSDAVPSTIDFVREGENGFTYPMGDLDALADRLDRVLGDPRVTAAMGARSRELIGSWSYEVDVAGVVAALDAVCARQG